MSGLQELLESVLRERISRGDLEHLTEEELGSFFGDAISDASDAIADSQFPKWKNTAKTGWKQYRSNREGFEKRLRKRWKHPLDLLDLFVYLSIEAGSEYGRKLRNEAVAVDNTLFEALTRLHAKACQASGEVLTLLRSGYADGAHARWRSIHEIAVVANFIGAHGRELAEQYLLHETIQQHKLAGRYRESFERLNLEPPDEVNYRNLSATRQNLKLRFGKAFDNEYGWASSTLGKESPTFSDIEQCVHLDHLRPYYRMASDNVHANSHGIYSRLGLHSTQEDSVALAGPSDRGLANPGHLTAISLLQVTTVLLTIEPIFDCLVILKALSKLTDEVGEAFINVHRELEDLRKIEE